MRYFYQKMSKRKGESMWIRPVCGGIAACTAETLTLPPEIARIRLMMFDKAGKTRLVSY